MPGVIDRIDEVLAPGTARWLASLPEDVRPTALPVRFPHMLNALAQRWANPSALRACLDDYLIDTRGNRSGLPLDVAEELATLKNYVETVVHPVPQTVWDEVAARQRAR